MKLSMRVLIQNGKPWDSLKSPVRECVCAIHGMWFFKSSKCGIFITNLFWPNVTLLRTYFNNFHPKVMQFANLNFQLIKGATFKIFPLLPKQQQPFGLILIIDSFYDPIQSSFCSNFWTNLIFKMLLVPTHADGEAVIWSMVCDLERGQNYSF